MIYVYRFGLGKWALLCILFIAGVMLAVQRYPNGFDPNTLPPPSAGLPRQESETAFPCNSMVYSISEDGVHYVRETGGGTVFAARLNQQVSFYQLNSYGYMTPVDQATRGCRHRRQAEPCAAAVPGPLAALGHLVHPERECGVGCTPELMPRAEARPFPFIPRVPSPPPN